jgi:hypothetical protein
VLQVSSAASIGEALTFMFIMSRPADEAVLLSNSNGGSAYLGVVKAGDTAQSQSSGMPGGATGYTAEQRINGNNFSARGDGWNAFEAGKFNSWTFRGFDWTGTTLYVNGYSTSGDEWKSSYEIKAVLAWDVYLTDAELRTAHNSFGNMATMDL